MIRGTTPLHTFTLPMSVDEIDSVRVLYSQREKLILRKETDDCTLEGNTVKCMLEQEDTFKLDHHLPVEIQVRIKTKDGKVTASYPIIRTVEECFDDEVI